MEKIDGQGMILTGSNDMLDFERTKNLLNPSELENKKVTIVGLGSGGSPVCDQLTMTGVKNWNLFDNDILEPINLVKHPRLRKDLNRPKVDIQKEWILDRNPEATVNVFNEDVMVSTNFKDCVKDSDLVLVCPDTKSVREYSNDICVNSKTPFVTASVFRTGIGGEAYSYEPNRTGCYRCLQFFAHSNNLNIRDDDLELTQEEKERIYGLGDKNFAASGLIIDITIITCIQARMALAILLRNSKTNKYPLLECNWIIWSNRPAPKIFDHHFVAQRFLLRPQNECNCSNIEENCYV